MARHFSYWFNIDSACPGIAFTNAMAFYTTTIILVRAITIQDIFH